MNGKCLICGSDLKHSQDSVCGGHGIYFNTHKLTCPICHITIHDDDYMHGVTREELETAHDSACREVISCVLTLNQ